MFSLKLIAIGIIFSLSYSPTILAQEMRRTTALGDGECLSPLPDPGSIRAGIDGTLAGPRACPFADPTLSTAPGGVAGENKLDSLTRENLRHESKRMSDEGITIESSVGLGNGAMGEASRMELYDGTKRFTVIAKMPLPHIFEEVRVKRPPWESSPGVALNLDEEGVKKVARLIGPQKRYELLCNPLYKEEKDLAKLRQFIFEKPDRNFAIDDELLAAIAEHRQKIFTVSNACNPAEMGITADQITAHNSKFYNDELKPFERLVGRGTDSPYLSKSYGLWKMGDDRKVLLLKDEGGSDLRQHIQKNAVTCAQALQWLHDGLQGVSELQKNGLIHKDIKDDNVIINEMGRLVLIDFGTMMEPGAPGEPWTGGNGMTAPPELSVPSRDNPMATASCYLGHDVWGMGQMIYNMIAPVPVLLNDKSQGEIDTNIDLAVSNFCGDDPSGDILKNALKGTLTSDPKRRFDAATITKRIRAQNPVISEAHALAMGHLHVARSPSSVAVVGGAGAAPPDVPSVVARPGGAGSSARHALEHKGEPISPDPSTADVPSAAARPGGIGSSATSGLEHKLSTVAEPTGRGPTARVSEQDRVVLERIEVDLSRLKGDRGYRSKREYGDLLTVRELACVDIEETKVLIKAYE